VIARKRPKLKSPLDHIRRAQELLEQVDEADGESSREVLHLRIQIAHLHLRAAEVSAKLPPEVRLVADSITAASLSQPVAGLGQMVGAMTPGQVAGIVDEKLAIEKRRGTI
jgi:hypothetical protein